MGEIFPMLLIIGAGFDTTEHNLFRPASNAGCADPAREILLNEYRVSEILAT